MKHETVPPFAPTLVESTRAIGYTTESAIADIIDNCIGAGASRVDITYFFENAYVAILDNGVGMSDKEITTAMQYGSKNPNESRDLADLGRFGLGLKTASLSQCRILTVVSKKNNTVTARRWDIDYINKTKEWSLLVLENNELADIPGFSELKKYKHGTLVVWQNLDRLLVGNVNEEEELSNKMLAVRKHLALVFHRYLIGSEKKIKKLDILMNNDPVIPLDPFLTKKSTQVIDDWKMNIDGNVVLVKAYLLPYIKNMNKQELALVGGKDGLRKSQGFYVYRNKRLLVSGTWFNMMPKGELTKLARIQIDIPNTLDKMWTLDIKKSTAIPPVQVRKNLTMIIEKLGEGSKRRWTVRSRKESDKKIIHMWERVVNADDASITYAINRKHPLISSLFNGGQNKKQIEAIIRFIEINLPLNLLYVDLNSDKNVVNFIDDLASSQNSKTMKSIIETINSLLLMFPTKMAKLEELTFLETVEPFSQYPELLNNVRRSIEHE